MRARVLGAIAARFPALVETLEVVGLVALVVGSILALAVAVVPARVVQPEASAAPESAAAEPPAASAAVDTFAVTADANLVLALEIGNRMYPDWKETRRVHLNEEFVLGDTENSAIVTRFLPDFLILDGKPRSVSRKLGNPAARVLVYLKGTPVDSSWAFLNFPPHYSPRSFFTFQLQEIGGYPAGAGAAAEKSASAPQAKSPAKPPSGSKANPATQRSSAGSE